VLDHGKADCAGHNRNEARAGGFVAVRSISRVNLMNQDLK